MYRRYNHCPRPTPRHYPGTEPYCVHLSTAGLATILPESARMASQVCPTATLVVQTTPAPNQPVGLTQVIEVPVIPGSPLPVATVGTTPASLTTQQQTQLIMLTESDPYNPANRFAQYFPSPPIPYICPVRLPSNEPAAPLVPCVPNQRFQGSTPE
jgi:hypothetical protein